MHRKTSGCAIVHWENRSPQQCTVWLTTDVAPGAVVAVTMRGDGEVIGFEVHTEKSDRSSPMDGGDEWFPELDGRSVLTARLVRDIPYGELGCLARDKFGEVAGWRMKTEQAYGDQGRAVEAARVVRALADRPGRRGHPDRYYAQIAVAYAAWVDSGKPLRILAGELNLSEAGLRTALAKARAKELLTAAPRGRKGGRATDLARQLAKEDDDGVD
jgi:hypothetical protein